MVAEVHHAFDRLHDEIPDELLEDYFSLLRSSTGMEEAIGARYPPGSL